MAVAMKRPDLLRSWCTDVIGVFDAEYVWHDLAQLWQTPGAGEEAVEAWASESVDQRAARLRSFGVTPDVATKLAVGYDMTMARCILTLYRSAAQPKMTQLGKDLASAAPRLARTPHAADAATRSIGFSIQMLQRPCRRCPSGFGIEVLDFNSALRRRQPAREQRHSNVSGRPSKSHSESSAATAQRWPRSRTDPGSAAPRCGSPRSRRHRAACQSGPDRTLILGDNARAAGRVPRTWTSADQR